MTARLCSIIRSLDPGFCPSPCLHGARLVLPFRSRRWSRDVGDLGDSPPPFIPRSKGLSEFIPTDTCVAQPGVPRTRRVCVFWGGGALGCGAPVFPILVFPQCSSASSVVKLLISRSRYSILYDLSKSATNL